MKTIQTVSIALAGLLCVSCSSSPTVSGALSDIISPVTTDLCTGPHSLATALNTSQWNNASLGINPSPTQQQAIKTASQTVVSDIQAACEAGTLKDFLLDSSKNPTLQQSLGHLIDAIWPITSGSPTATLSPGDVKTSPLIALNNMPFLAAIQSTLQTAGVSGSAVSSSPLASFSQLYNQPIPVSQVNATLKQIFGI